METDKRRWFEAGAVILTGALRFVLSEWLELRLFYIAAVCLFWAVYIYKRRQGNAFILRDWGFQRKNFKQSFLFLTPFALAGVAGIVWYGLAVKAVFLNWHVIPIFVFYPVWGVFQQFLVIPLIVGNLYAISTLKLSRPQIILLTSFLFALVHYPSLTLMLFAFVMELLFLTAYFRWKNLWSLGLYHGWLGSLFLYFVIGRDLWSELWSIF
ncbi:MAG: CPBP family glutamic-type intramembrane protease [Prolixibacteraceae bacterium]